MVTRSEIRLTFPVGGACCDTRGVEGISKPTGTVSFVFTDVEGSTRAWELYPAEMRLALARHDEILRSVIATHGGVVFSTAGDAYAAAFSRPDDAVAACEEAQRRLVAGRSVGPDAAFRRCRAQPGGDAAPRRRAAGRTGAGASRFGGMPAGNAGVARCRRSAGPPSRERERPRPFPAVGSAASRMRDGRSAFAGYRFPPEVILLAVRWYLRYGLSYRDVEELLAERGIEVDHVTIYRRVQRFTPTLSDAARPCRHTVGGRWFVDETYVKVTGKWRYVYRAVAQHGQIIDVYVSAKRDITAARTFFTAALTAHGEPDEVITDLAQALETVIEKLIPNAFHNTERYANTRVECDHGRLKSLLRPMRGLKTDRTASVVIRGHAFIQNLRRGHCELGVETRHQHLRVAAAFNQLTETI